MSVQELERAVSELSPQEFAEFAAWFEEFVADQWDRQIEADVAAGKLDQFAKKADEDFEAGRCAELPRQGLKSLATEGDPRGVAKCGPARDHRG